MKILELLVIISLSLFRGTLSNVTSVPTSQYFLGDTGYSWTDETKVCTDFIDCTVNCYQAHACTQSTIIGPTDASLTINCDSNEIYGGYAQYGCNSMTIYAQNSTTLTINIYNEQQEFDYNIIYTPLSSTLNTFITAGIVGSNNDNTSKTQYNSAQHIYSLLGWETVEWTYSGASVWSLYSPLTAGTMYCGNDYLSKCKGWNVDGFFYRCTNLTSSCDYDRSTQSQSGITYFLGDDTYAWDGVTKRCDAYKDCVLNCYTANACQGLTIVGPIGATLTINCDSHVFDVGWYGWNCYLMNIYAQNSTELYINIYNEAHEFATNNHIYTPIGSTINTFITAGITSPDRTWEKQSVDPGQHIYSINGWDTVLWTYFENSSWTLPNPDTTSVMHCGSDYLTQCSGWDIAGFWYHCTANASVCDEDRTNEPRDLIPTEATMTPTNPTVDPVVHPTFDPTVEPTIDPITDPTKATIAPTIDPITYPTKATINPTTVPTTGPTTDPTTDPTIDPINDPTIYPTTDPTIDPTIDPTTDPTIDPTNDPTIDPTNDPTIYPTTDPTIDPTIDPSIGPTVDPTNIPTIDPSVVPTIDPTVDPSVILTTDVDYNNDDDQLSVQQHEAELKSLSELYQRALFAVIGFFLLIAIFSLIDAKMIRTNDYFRVVAIIKTAIQVADMLSDSFFAAEVGIQRNNQSNISFDIMFAASVVFIVVPAITALVQLHRQATKHWLSNDYIRAWLSQYFTLLLLLSVVTGSAFAAVTILNSYIFHLEIFDMGLTDKQLNAFNTHRVYSIVLLENLPQVVIQTYYIYSVDAGGNAIALSSITFSVISIIVSVLDMTVQKTINYTQQYVVLSMDITGDCVVERSRKCKTLRVGVRRRIAALIGVDDNTIEIMKPTHIEHGFLLRMNVFSNSKKDFEQVLMEKNEQNKLAKIFKDNWDLNDLPLVTGIESHVIISKQQTRVEFARMTDEQIKVNDVETEMETPVVEKEGNLNTEGEVDQNKTNM